MGLSEIEKARRYEMRAPGLDIPIEQKAERFERYAIKEKNAGLPRTKRRVLQHSVSGFGGTCWCSCGKFKDHDGAEDCK